MEIQKKKNQEINVHIMHSMKGGCGKSTCSLFKALQLAREWGLEDKKAGVLYLDADFKGSAMMHLLFRTEDISEGDVVSKEDETKNQWAEINKSDIKDLKGSGFFHQFAYPAGLDKNKTLSHYLKDNEQLPFETIVYHTYSFLKLPKNSRTQEEERTSSITVNSFLDFILPSISAESKDWFRFKQGKIPVGIYSYRMEALLNSILRCGLVSKKEGGRYKDIVIDMPPGYDEYSDILLDILRKTAKANKNIKLNYYGVTTEDVGHRTLTKENIRKMMAVDTDYKAFDTVNLVLNGASEVDFKNLQDSSISEYKGWIKLQGRAAGNVYRNFYSESYHIFCRQATAQGFTVDLDKVLKKL